MSLRSLLRSLEKSWIRPLGRRLRLPRLGRGSRRLADLESRVEELESLVRELTGLVSLHLDDAATEPLGPCGPLAPGSPRDAWEAA